MKCVTCHYNKNINKIKTSVHVVVC